MKKKELKDYFWTLQVQNICQKAQIDNFEKKLVDFGKFVLKQRGLKDLSAEIWDADIRNFNEINK